VIGFKADCLQDMCLKFSPWQHRLGVIVDPVVCEQFQCSEIVAICLQDMAWSGFSSKQVVNFRREIIRNENCLLAIFEYEAF
jgi:hypothetical protein